MTALDLLASDDRSRSERLAQWTRVLCVLFFFSGFPALIYQLTWQRTLFRIFGVNIESVTIVVTAFMLGLGFGSLAGGWLSKRRGITLLPLLAGIEILTGTFGVFSLAIFDQIGDLTAGWPLPAMAAVNLGLVLVPTLLMGATLPVLVAHLVRRTGGVGSAVGLLYYVNTLGAGAACRSHQWATSAPAATTLLPAVSCRYPMRYSSFARCHTPRDRARPRSPRR